MKVASRKYGFTLIEMLVVIAILGILAGLAVPALKDLGKANVNLSASRQLLDDIGHARQLAMSQRQTVYMVFVPTNFWDNPGTLNLNNTWFNNLTPAQQTAATNLADKELTGYTFIGSGAVGDQPGRHSWHYLAPWQSLPDGTFIAQQKFSEQPNQFYTIQDPVSGAAYDIHGFTNTAVPFPSETNANYLFLPRIAFNSLGQLTADGQTLADRDEYIPLVKGGVSPPIDPQTKVLVLSDYPRISEAPPGNGTNISYNVIHIDRLSGRAVLEFHKMP